MIHLLMFIHSSFSIFDVGNILDFNNNNNNNNLKKL